MRRALIAVGVLMMGYAAFGAFQDRVHLKLPYLRFLAGAWLLNDLVMIPIAIGVGVLIGHIVRGPARAWVQAATFISAVLLAIAFPFVLGRGKAADLPSALPRDYGRGLLILLGVVWLVAATGIAVGAWRRGRAREG